MNRKEMIIAATLINVGLLITLMVISVKKEKPVVIIPDSSRLAAQNAASEATSLSTRLSAPPLSRSSAPPLPKKVSALPQPETRLTTLKKQETKLVALDQPQPETMKRTFIVKKGDVLEKIAKHHGITVEDILHANQLKTTRLQIGQELTIPSVQRLEKPQEHQQPKALAEKYHIVQEGENPWLIAKRHRIKVEELLRLNQLTQEEAKKLRPGQSLRIAE